MEAPPDLIEVISSFSLGLKDFPRSFPRYTKIAEMIPVPYSNVKRPTLAVMDTNQAYWLHRVDSIVSSSSNVHSLDMFYRVLRVLLANRGGSTEAGHGENEECEIDLLGVIHLNIIVKSARYCYLIR